jgi:hypothetical protein
MIEDLEANNYGLLEIVKDDGKRRQSCEFRRGALSGA